MESCFYSDFYIFWTAAKFALLGQNFYNNPELLKYLQEYTCWESGWSMYGFPYPPSMIFFYILAGFLTYQNSYYLYIFINIFLIYCIFKFTIPSTYKFSLKANLFLSLFITFPAFYLFINAQTSALIATFTFLALVAAKKNNYRLSGLCFSIALLKPHLIVPIYLYFILKNKSKLMQIILGTFIGISIQVIIVYLFNPDLILNYISYIPNYINTISVSKYPTIYSLIKEIFNISLRSYMPIFSILTVVILSFYNLDYKKVIIYLVAPLTLLLAAHAWPNDCMLLFPCYLLFQKKLCDKFSFYSFWIINCCFLILCLAIFYLFHTAGLIIIPILLLIFGIQEIKKIRPSNKSTFKQPC